MQIGCGLINRAAKFPAAIAVYCKIAASRAATTPETRLPELGIATAPPPAPSAATISGNFAPIAVVASGPTTSSPA
jgi:hypothetical protein